MTKRRQNSHHGSLSPCFLFLFVDGFYLIIYRAVKVFIELLTHIVIGVYRITFALVGTNLISVEEFVGTNLEHIKEEGGAAVVSHRYYYISISIVSCIFFIDFGRLL